MQIRGVEFRFMARAVRIAEQCARARRAPFGPEIEYILLAVQHLAAIEEREAMAAERDNGHPK